MTDFHRVLLILAFLGIACPSGADDDDVSDDDDTSDDDDATADLERPLTLDGGCSMEDRFGVFAVEGQELFVNQQYALAHSFVE